MKMEELRKKLNEITQQIMEDPNHDENWKKIEEQIVTDFTNYSQSLEQAQRITQEQNKHKRYKG